MEEYGLSTPAATHGRPVLATVREHAARAAPEKLYDRKTIEIASGLHKQLHTAWSELRTAWERVRKRDWRQRVQDDAIHPLEPQGGWVPYRLPPTWAFKVTAGTATRWTERGRDRLLAAARKATDELAHRAGVHLFVHVVVAPTQHGNAHLHALVTIDPLAVTQHGLAAIISADERESVFDTPELTEVRRELDSYFGSGLVPPEEAARRELLVVRKAELERDALCAPVAESYRAWLRRQGCDPGGHPQVDVFDSSAEALSGRVVPADHAFELYLAGHLWRPAVVAKPVLDSWAICPGRTGLHNQCANLRRPCLYGCAFEKAPGGGVRSC
jgi:hypothetical protein